MRKALERLCSSILFVGLVLISRPACSESRNPRIVFNDDAQVLSEAPEVGTSDFIRDWLDRESEAVRFSTFVFLAAMPDICIYESKVGEVYGARFGNSFRKHWATGIRGLRYERTDVLRVVTAHMKSKGKEVIAAIRMSDTHHRKLNKSDPLCPQFTLDNPQYVIKQPDGRNNETALDYSIPVVRIHRLAIMSEVAERYDVDGLELNFVRWAKHFPRNQGRAKAAIMTKYIGEIRKMLDGAANKRKRKRLTLGVRIPESLHACWLAGVDIETWVKQGWIDYVVISTWNNTDPQLPIDEFTRFTKPANVDTIVVMGNMIGAIWSGLPRILDRPHAMSAKHGNGYVGMLITPAEARAAAANYYLSGADSISFWNVGIHFGKEKTATPQQQKRIAEWTRAVQNIETVFQGPRTYRYLPMGKGISSRKPPVRNYPWYDEGYSPLGQRNSPVLRFTAESKGKRLSFPFRMADGRNGERLAGLMRFWIYGAGENDRIDVDLNGKPIDASKITLAEIGARRGGLTGLRFEIDLANCPKFRGNNTLGLTWQTEITRATSPYMEELEVTVTTLQPPLK